jgi:hypothetical protein
MRSQRKLGAGTKEDKSLVTCTGWTGIGLPRQREGKEDTPTSKRALQDADNVSLYDIGERLPLGFCPHLVNGANPDEDYMSRLSKQRIETSSGS